jgi:FixJ family two-component response regulator
MGLSPVIHLIDDDDGVRSSLAFSLSTAGLAVRTYASAAAFLEAFVKQRAKVSRFRG